MTLILDSASQRVRHNGGVRTLTNMTTPLVKVLALSAFAGLVAACVIDPEAEDEELGTMESSLCLIPPTPPPYSTLWYLPDAQQRYEPFSYGTGECSAKVLAARNTMYLGAAVSNVANAAACTETTVTARIYLKVAGIWSLLVAESRQGSWNATTGCFIPPSIGHYLDANQEARIHASAKRTTCAGAVCGTTYGVPVTIHARGNGS